MSTTGTDLLNLRYEKTEKGIILYAYFICDRCKKVSEEIALDYNGVITDDGQCNHCDFNQKLSWGLDPELREQILKTLNTLKEA